jgi:hypothetical protein
LFVCKGVIGVIGKPVDPWSPSAVPSLSAEAAPTQRDRHLRTIAECGRVGWQKAGGYNRRAKVEVSIGRSKRVIDDALRSRTDQTEATKFPSLPLP